jgi:hypothetical protein
MQINEDNKCQRISPLCLVRDRFILLDFLRRVLMSMLIDRHRTDNEEEKDRRRWQQDTRFPAGATIREHKSRPRTHTDEFDQREFYSITSRSLSLIIM